MKTLLDRLNPLFPADYKFRNVYLLATAAEDDEQMTTVPGDIVLYSGNQIVVFYGSNTWPYTKLGHITEKSEQELAELLNNGNVTIRVEAAMESATDNSRVNSFDFEKKTVLLNSGQEQDVVPFIQEKGIVVQCWYPLGGRGHTSELLGNETICDIAVAHGVSPAQVILRWDLQRGIVVIPGSGNPEHIKENLELFDFELTEEEMNRINSLDRKEKHDWY